MYGNGCNKSQVNMGVLASIHFKIVFASPVYKRETRLNTQNQPWTAWLWNFDSPHYGKYKVGVCEHDSWEERLDPTEGYRKLLEELRYFYSSAKSKRICQVGHITCTGHNKNSHEFCRKTRREQSGALSTDETITLKHLKTGCEDVNCIHVTRGRILWPALVTM